MSKAVVSLTTGLEDPEKASVAVFVAVFVAVGVACDGCPSIQDLVKRHLDADDLVPGAEIDGTVPMWNWIGEEAATTYSY